MTHRTATTRRVSLALLLALAACLTAFAAATQAKSKSHGHGSKHHSKATKKGNKGTAVRVMTRNLYLGADLTPAIASKSTSEFIEANGEIVRQVESHQLPRARQGAGEGDPGKAPTWSACRRSRCGAKRRPRWARCWPESRRRRR